MLKSPKNMRSVFEEMWNSSRGSNLVKNVDMNDEDEW